MAQITRAQYITNKDNRFADSPAQNITALESRQQYQETADSTLFKSDDTADDLAQGITNLYLTPAERAKIAIGVAWNDPVDNNIVPDSNNIRSLGSAAINFLNGFFTSLTLNGVSLTNASTKAIGIAAGNIVQMQTASVAGNFAKLLPSGLEGRTPAQVLTDISAEPVNAALLKSDVAATLTAGYAHTTFDNGSQTTGTLTPNEANGSVQQAINGGAHALAPPINDGTILLKYTNGASAGVIDTSAFTKVDGDPLDTTLTNAFFLSIMKVAGSSTLTVKALQ